MNSGGLRREETMNSERRSEMPTSTDPNPAEVEALLKAAQDDVLLKLSVNSHTLSNRLTLPPSSSSPPFSSDSSPFLDPHLSRRFDALRSQPAPAAHARDPSHQDGGGGAAPGAATSAAGDEILRGRDGGEDEVNRILGDDLAARFAALKGSSSSFLPASNIAQPPVPISEEEVDDDDSEESDNDGDGVSKEEVEKLMQWAMDAARLDPNPNSGDDGEGIGKESVEEEGEEESEQEEEGAARANEKRKEKEEEEAAAGKKPSSRKWFFF